MRGEWDRSQAKLDLQTLLIHCLQEPTSFLLVNLEASPQDLVALLLEDHQLNSPPAFFPCVPCIPWFQSLCSFSLPWFHSLRRHGDQGVDVEDEGDAAVA